MIDGLVDAGSAIELGGVTVVFVQIAHLEQLLSEAGHWWSGPVLLVRRLWRRIRSRREVNLSGQINMTFGGVAVAAVGQVESPRSGTLEEQLAGLWAAIDRMSQQVEGLTRSVRGQLPAEIEATRREQRQVSEELRKLIRESVLGSRRWQVGGAFAIVLGIVLVWIGSIA